MENVRGEFRGLVCSSACLMWHAPSPPCTPWTDSKCRNGNKGERTMGASGGQAADVTFVGGGVSVGDTME